MKKLRYVLASILMLGLAIPGVSLADNDDDSDRRRCSNIGTWFGVADVDAPIPTGVFWTVMGKSEKTGINILEFPNIPDPTLGGFFETAVKTSALRGTWDRVSNNSFLYTATGFALDESNTMVGIMRFRGDVTLYRRCQFAYVTTKIDIYYPGMSPFTDDPFWTIPFDPLWGRRAYVELP